MGKLGGNSGLGLAIAKRFKAEGASVAILGRNSETLESAVSDIDGDTISSIGDVRVCLKNRIERLAEYMRV